MKNKDALQNEKSKKSKKKKPFKATIISISIVTVLVFVGTIIDEIAEKKWGINLFSNAPRYKSGGTALVICSLVLIFLIILLITKRIQYKQNRIKLEEWKAYKYSAIIGVILLIIAITLIVVVGIVTYK